MDTKKWLGISFVSLLLIGCGGGGGDDSEVASPIDGDRIKKEDINDFLDQKSSATSIELLQTYKREFPTQYETDYNPKIDTVLVGGAEGGGFSNDIVFGVSAIFPEDYVLANGPCDGAIQLYLDTDMNADTGYAIDGIGVDFIVVGDGYLLDDSGVYYYDSSSDNFVSHEFPGGTSLWQPRFSQGNNGYISSCIDGDTPGNITIKRMVSVYSSSDLLNTESRGIIHIDRINPLRTKPFHIPALTQTDSDSNSDDNTFNLTGTHSYKGYYQECESDKAEGTVEFDASYYLAEGEDWHSDCDLTSFTDSGSHTLENIESINSSEFDVFLRGWYPQDTFQIEYLTFNESGIKAKITDSRDASIEIFEIASIASDVQSSVDTIDIIGTWNYSYSSPDCLNIAAEGTATWTYHSDGYGLSIGRTERLSLSSCSFVDATDFEAEGHYPASNPITPKEFQAGWNYIDSGVYWQSIEFESANKIILTGIDDGASRSEVLIVFTRD